jgi:hypothetical protein
VWNYHVGETRQLESPREFALQKWNQNQPEKIYNAENTHKTDFAKPEKMYSKPDNAVVQNYA